MSVNFEKFKPKNDTHKLILGLYDHIKGLEENLVTKDAFGVGVPYSQSPSTGHFSNTGSAMGQQASSTNQFATVVWPAPNQWHTHGSEAAKKAWVEYLNAANQYQQEEGPERKLELAGRMNIDITSILQGLQIGTEAAEQIQKRVRTGDQAAVLEKEQVKDIITKLLKLLWVHNTAARSGKNAGLEFKPMDGQLTGRINRAAQIACADDGMSLEAGEDPDAIFASEYNPMPSQEQQMQAQQEAEATAGAQTGETQPEMEGEQMEAQENPAEETAAPQDVAEEQIPPEETPQGEEQTPQEDLQQQAAAEETPVEETVSPDEQQAQDQGTMEDLVGEEQLPEEEAPPEEEPIEEAPVEGEPQEQIPTEEEGEAQEEIDEAQDQSAEADAERAEADEAQTEADEQEAEAQEAEDQADEESQEAGEETGEALTDEEPPEETAEEEVEDEEDEEEPLYCIECDREVDEDDIANCENPNCPFRDKGQEETSEEEPVQEEKHYVFMGREDHTDCNTANFTVKEFDGVRGCYCHDHKAPVHYEFDQSIWTSQDAHKWVNKNTKTYNIKKKSAEEILYDKLLDNPLTVESLVTGWIEERKKEKQASTEEIKTKSIIEIDFDESQLDGALSEALNNAFSGIDNTLRKHGV